MYQLQELFPPVTRLFFHFGDLLHSVPGEIHLVNCDEAGLFNQLVPEHE